MRKKLENNSPVKDYLYSFIYPILTPISFLCYAADFEPMISITVKKRGLSYKNI